jgi:hypothetical protein
VPFLLSDAIAAPDGKVVIAVNVDVYCEWWSGPLVLDINMTVSAFAEIATGPGPILVAAA